MRRSAPHPAVVAAWRLSGRVHQHLAHGPRGDPPEIGGSVGDLGGCTSLSHASCTSVVGVSLPFCSWRSTPEARPAQLLVDQAELLVERFSACDYRHPWGPRGNINKKNKAAMTIPAGFLRNWQVTGLPNLNQISTPSRNIPRAHSNFQEERRKTSW